MGVMKLHHQFYILIIFIGLCSNLVKCIHKDSDLYDVRIDIPPECPQPSTPSLKDLSDEEVERIVNCTRQFTQPKPNSTTTDDSIIYPIDTVFKLPSPLPQFPKGGGFATGAIDLGGLEVTPVETFTRLFSFIFGGPNNFGVSFFEPSYVPQDYFMLGHYCQPNTQPLFGYVLFVRDISGNPSAPLLATPKEYVLVWSTEMQAIKTDRPGYIWKPIPPDNYKCLGLIVTNTPEAPPLDKIRCVRVDFTEEIELEGPYFQSPFNVLNVYSSKPKIRNEVSLGVPTGTFVTKTEVEELAYACLKNVAQSNFAMPSREQIDTLIQAYAPIVFFHPEEEFLPSSVNWFFQNGALLYSKDGPDGVPIEPSGANLPQLGSDDGYFWLDLPRDDNPARELVQKGNVADARTNIHVKSANGFTFTDIVFWIYYPYNGPGSIKVEFVTISTGWGQHVGDWEHVTLRISNFNGELKDVYFSQHAKGEWFSAAILFYELGNKPAVYSSHHGHAMYPYEGVAIDGGGGVGVRNDMGRGLSTDTGINYELISVRHLGNTGVVEPPWLNYARLWGPHIITKIEEIVQDIADLLPEGLKEKFYNWVHSILPEVIFGENGPSGPKWKDSWEGEERT